MAIEDGHAIVPDTPGLGIEWLWPEIERRAVERSEIR
jgi:L-alanine-DL-glutamate epimerase-like enolase superfamily enzyme